jgi:CBS domain-containing protein
MHNTGSRIMTTRTKTPSIIADVMTSEPICLTPDTTVRELSKVLDLDEISGAPVVDGQGRVVGVVSRTDLLHHCANASGRADRSFFETLSDELEDGSLTEIDVESLGVVEDFMSRDPITVSPQHSIAAVAWRMAEAGVHRVIVTDEQGGVQGIVSALDLLAAFPST